MASSTLDTYPVHSSDAPTTAILKAAHFSAIRHRFQKRKDGGTPYINHPIGVATLLAVEGGITDPDVLSAAILHDTVEDTETSPAEILEHFGPRVASIVAEVTDDKDLPAAERKLKQVELAAKKSPEAQVLKMADKLYNLRDMVRRVPNGWTAERVQEYFRWSKSVTDQCRHVNPRLAALLDDLYQNATFEHGGKTYKCLADGSQTS
ncbi:HD domain-containing protein 3 [Catenaria anguillulae PL171]|uniref:Guanosine-3',5'-bis(diphosphate) 3'-pyrophosphohydrolase MESH1 n=1 Tax=Catenaria anguillulae PL171 TaxID=765915 RepID=A0A1Y2H463_9FUNG|nr:HD domain-containing protein 3 [Catenaria anguillulae PL171]